MHEELKTQKKEKFSFFPTVNVSCYLCPFGFYGFRLPQTSGSLIIFASSPQDAKTVSTVIYVLTKTF